MRKMPQWKIPANISERLEVGDGFWEDLRWNPLVLTLMSGTSINGRDVPLAWQIEFEPGDDAFDSANELLAEKDIEPDGYGWGEAIKIAMQEKHPEVSQLHFDDCEEEACVIWTESEEDCRKLLEVTWKLLFGS
jgi:hypothetical protein